MKIECKYIFQLEVDLDDYELNLHELWVMRNGFEVVIKIDRGEVWVDECENCSKVMINIKLTDDSIINLTNKVDKLYAIFSQLEEV